MNTYTGSAYSFRIAETVINDSDSTITLMWGTLPVTVAYLKIQYRVIGAGSWTDIPPFTTGYTGRTFNIDTGDNEFQILLLDVSTATIETITFDRDVIDLLNFIQIPFLNPVKFYKTTRANLPKYFTKHFDDFKFSERGYDWEQEADYSDPWQTTDIIYLQFESTFDPIIVSLVNGYGQTVISLPALIGLPNKYVSGLYAFEVEMSLANLEEGCYYLQVEAGSGDTQEIYISGCQCIKNEHRNSIILEYWNTRSKGDVLFETGIQFQKRFLGHIGKLEPVRKDEMYKDQLYNPAILSNVSARQWPVFFGDEFGLPDDAIDLINRIWGCDNVLIDNKPFGITEGGKIEFTEIDSNYRKRGVKIIVEEGVNRNSSIFSPNVDTTKKLFHAVVVDANVFGDTSNQGSSNAVPLITVIPE